MTLIACLHPRQSRTLLADILILSPDGGEIGLPTRAYLAPERLRNMEYKPAALRRKIIEIAPDLALLWSEDYNAARVLATRAQEWLTDPNYNEEDLRRLLDTYYIENESQSLMRL
jgi:hypothetical protein